MYFHSRKQAGQLLAQELAEGLGGKECSVVALNEGGVLVGMQLAMRLQCSLTMLLVDPVLLPGEIDAIGTIGENGAFAYNTMYSPGEIEEMVADYRGYIEEKKQTQLSQLHQMTGMAHSINTDELESTHVVLVSDALRNAQSLDIAMEILKPVSIKSLNVAAPICTPEAFEKLRVMCDKVFYLRLVSNFLGADHYYDNEPTPDREEVLRAVQEFAAADTATDEDVVRD